MSTSPSDDTLNTLDVVASLLLRCFIITVGAQIFVWVVVFLMGDGIFSIYTQIMDITRKEYDLFFLYIMTFIKSLNVVFFLIPFLAIKWFLTKRR